MSHLPNIVLCTILTLICWIGPRPEASGQSFLDHADSLDTRRYYTALGLSTATYGAFAVGLYQLWYADYPRTSFQLYNDWGEWENMDKWGHAYNGYFQTALIFQGTRWTGRNRKSSLWHGIAGSLLFQSTIEVLDGFSAEWGFSVPDMMFNIGGTAAFAVQELIWQEQRFKIKMNALPVRHSSSLFTGSEGTATSLEMRAEELFTTALASQILKDYNAQIYWLSFRPVSKEVDWWPRWLNLATGYGAENMYGGYENNWETNGEVFSTTLQRQHQFYLSLDIDLEKIQTKNKFLKSCLYLLNIVKIPMPALEYNSDQGFYGHWLR